MLLIMLKMKLKLKFITLLTVINTKLTKIVHNLLFIRKDKKTRNFGKKVDNVNNFVDNC